MGFLKKVIKERVKLIFPERHRNLCSCLLFIEVLTINDGLIVKHSKRKDFLSLPKNLPCRLFLCFMVLL
jgi:hypothetical protein